MYSILRFSYQKINNTEFFLTFAYENMATCIGRFVTLTVTI